MAEHTASRPVHRKRSTCRLCGGADLSLFLSLGPTPLANAFLRSPLEFGEERLFPLDVYFCGGCSLVQLLDVIDPEVLFRNYVYVTGTSTTVARHNLEYADTVGSLIGSDKHPLVMEVASNDGSLLECFRSRGFDVLGIEPATNIARIAEERGIPTVNQFFNSGVARDVRRKYGPASAVAANNVLAHVDGLADFVNGFAELLAPGGMVTVEVPYLANLLEGVEYDTIYHEHLSYFSVTTVTRLFGDAGLSVFRIDRQSIHGGSLRVYATNRKGAVRHGEEILQMVAAEQAAGIPTLERCMQFARQVQANRGSTMALLKEISQTHTVAGYGAPAKGNTLLNYCGIGPGLLPFTVDKNGLKVGSFTPGTHIPVMSLSSLRERQPDYVFILPWNFADEIIAQERAFLGAGCRFIVPVPEPRVI